MIRVVHAVLAGALAAVPAACNDGGGQIEGGGGQTPPVEATPAPAASGEGTGAGQPPPAQPPADGSLVSRDVQSEGHALTVDITELKRQGQSATLSFRITNAGGGDSYWGVYETLGTAANDYTVSGVVLVDPVNAQRYLVARSGGEDGPCACSQTGDVLLYVGDSAEFFATYAAPPPDVTTVNVEFPTFGAFTDVPIS